MLGEPAIRASTSLRIAGVCFHGNPFERADSWSERTGIDRLWDRYERTLSVLPGFPGALLEPDVRYEIRSDGETAASGAFDVFAGQRVDEGAEVPFPLCWKRLPAVSYAVFRVGQEAGEEDWSGWISSQWLSDSRWEAGGAYVIQRRTAGSQDAFEAWIPVRERG